MSTMVSLVGEQPIPCLLPIKHLKPDRILLVCTERSTKVARSLQRLLADATEVRIPAYDLTKSLTILMDQIGERQELIFNLTGGTKLMALAAFALAAQSRSPFIYLESEQRASRLYHYRFDSGLPVLEGAETIPELITVDEYLKAHLPGYRVDGFHRDGGRLSDGGRFEKAVFDALQRGGFEVLAGVRPEGVADQIEVDLAVRLGNQVGIAEVKLGDAKGERAKAGLDQLAMAGGREYLGTYTAKFLICARMMPPRIRALANERDIVLIELPRYEGGDTLSLREAELLRNKVGQTLCGGRSLR